MSASPTRGSAAWLTAIVATVMFVIGALLLSVVDPVMQTLFDSSLFTAETVIGTTFLGYLTDFWSFLAIAILIAILLTVWIGTRRAG